MSDQTAARNIRQMYRLFAENEAHDVSPLYEAFAEEVANNEVLVQFIESLPEGKRQPNLVFAAVRHVCGTIGGPEKLMAEVIEHGERIRSVVLARSTQTNEPGRCATLLPVLAALPQPLALIEVGASAGLCLLPDRYGYDYGGRKVLPENEQVGFAPVFPCKTIGETPIPSALPEVIWRMGIDLNPIDLREAEESAWLESLVWPCQEGRAERLKQAVEIAKAGLPPVVKGNLLHDLPRYAAQAPDDATLVVFHSAVLAYLPSRSDRGRFTAIVRDSDAVWISNEAPGVLPEVAAKLEIEVPRNRFILAVDGEPVAFTGPHGQCIEWIGNGSFARDEWVDVERIQAGAPARQEDFLNGSRSPREDI